MVTRVTVIGRPFWRYLSSGRPKPETALFQIGYPSSQGESPDRVGTDTAGFVPSGSGAPELRTPRCWVAASQGFGQF